MTPQSEVVPPSCDGCGASTEWACGLAAVVTRQVTVVYQRLIRGSVPRLRDRRSAVDVATLAAERFRDRRPLGRAARTASSLEPGRRRDHGPDEDRARSGYPAAAGGDAGPARARCRLAAWPHARLRLPVSVDDGRHAIAVGARHAVPRRTQGPRVERAAHATWDASDLPRPRAPGGRARCRDARGRSAFIGARRRHRY